MSKANQVEFKSAYSQKLRVAVQCNDKSRTKQAMKDECDVNLIVKNFSRTGLIEHRNNHRGDYGEFSQIDFHEAMNTVIKAEAMFMELPAKTRKEFLNDPGEFLAFVQNPENKDKLIEMGLATEAQLSDADRIVKAIETQAAGGVASGDGEGGPTSA
jgi:phage internal scaffolding protein